MTTNPVLSNPSINWPMLMKRYEQGELDRQQFCQENHISLPQFKYHRAKLKRASIHATTASLIPITLQPTVVAAKPITDNTSFQITFMNGIYCQIPVSIKAEKLKQLMEVLQAC